MHINKEFIFLKKMSWHEVFELWHNNEYDSESWKQFYQQRGFTSWSNWRITYAHPLYLDELDWSLYKIKNPAQSVSDFYGGPFTAWKKYYYGDQDTLQFKDLLNIKAFCKIKPKINRLSENFPLETFLIGLIVKEKIVIIEGTHRCLAVSFLAQKNKKFKNIVNIALAKSKLYNLPIIGGTQ